jgi:NTE family protein
MKNLGLALGGGGLKGLAHIGVLQVLDENHIKPAYISGTSAGSIIAALYASGLTPNQIEQEVTKLSPSDYVDYNIIGVLKYLFRLIMPGYKYSLDGILTGNKIEKLVHKLTRGKSLSDVELPISIVSCDIDSGRKIIFTNQNMSIDDDDSLVVKDALLSEAVRSSISIPVTFQPKKFRGMQMVDGGLKDIVPVITNKFMGADYVQAVNLGKEIYQNKVRGIPQIISRTISIMTYETSDTEEEFFADMLLYPGVADVSLTNLKEAAQIIRAGRRVMRDNIDKLKKELMIDE